jgi:flagellar hook-associated protein 3 FlgL
VSSRTIARTQQALIEAQNQLSTGKRLNAPSDDPGESAIALQLRKTLERSDAYLDNLKQAASQLGEVDSTLGTITDLLQQAQTIASANVGSDVTDGQRQSAAEIVKSLYGQMLSLANRQFEGIYLFAGTRSDQQAFIEQGGGVRFVGSTQLLSNAFDSSTIMPFMVDGSEIFGALSSRVQGTADLTPALTGATRLTDLRGAGGQGVRLGSIRMGDGSTFANVDLSNADTIRDVIDAINASGLSITASIGAGATGITLTPGPGDDITVSEIGGGTTASDLGILHPVGSGAGVPLVGTPTGPRLTALTPLATLNAGAGIDLVSGLTITNGQASATIDLSGCTTVEDMLNAINAAGTGVRAEMNQAATGINILNPVQGTLMSIGENGGTTASDLGVRSFRADSPLAELNGGRGVRTATSGADLQITRTDGTSFQVTLAGLATVQDVLDAINAAAGGTVTADLAASGNGIVLNDTAGGAGTLTITALNFSSAAEDLGLAIPAASTSTSITGADVNRVGASGIFSNLGKLRDALLHGDQRAITEAAEALAGDHQRVVRARGRSGATVQDLESRRNHLEDQNVATRALLSELEDTDFAEAVERFQTLQNSLQAGMMTAARVMDLSLLDFLA